MFSEMPDQGSMGLTLEKGAREADSFLKLYHRGKLIENGKVKFKLLASNI